MAIAKLGEIDYVKEVTFGVDPGSTFTKFHAYDISWEPEQEELENDYQKESLYQVGAVMGSKANGKFGFKVHSYGWSSALPTGDPTDYCLSDFVAACMGYKSTNKYDGTGCTTNGTANTFILTASNWNIGEFVCLQDGTTYEVSCITNKQADTPAPGDYTYTVYPEFSSAAITEVGNKVFGAITFSGQDSISGNSIMFRYRKSPTEAGWKLNGCRGTFKLHTPAKQLPYLEFSFNVNSWTRYDHTGLVDEASYALPAPEAAMGCKFFYNDTSGKAWDDDLHVAESTFDIGNEIMPKESTKANQGNADFLLGERKATVSFVPDYDADYETYHGAQTEKFLMQVIGTQPGKMIAYAIPRAIVTGFPGLGETSSRLTQTVTVKEGKYEGDTGSRAVGTDHIDAEVRFAFI